MDENRHDDPIFSFTICTKLNLVIAADTSVKLLNAVSFYQDFDCDSLMEQGLIKIKSKASRLPIIID